MTQDLDFSDARRFIPGRHHSIILIRLSSPSRSWLVRRIEDVYRNENVGLWPGCFAVVTEGKVRVRAAIDQP